MPQALLHNIKPHVLSFDLTQGIYLQGISAAGVLWLGEFDEDAHRRHQVRYRGVWPPDILSAPPAQNLPADLIAPQTPGAPHPLDKTATRLRGLRETDRLADWLYALPIADKMALMPHLPLPPGITPMQILGISESRVLSIATLTPDVSLLCRRLRLAYALPGPQVDADGLPYDYDSLTLHLLHTHAITDADDALLTTEHLSEFAGVGLHQPVDCLSHAGYLYIADDGGGQQPNRLHIWRIGAGA